MSRSSAGLGFNTLNIYAKTHGRNTTLTGSPAFPPTSRISVPETSKFHPTQQGPTPAPVGTAGLSEHVLVRDLDFLKTREKTLQATVSQERGHVRDRLKRLASQSQSIYNEVQFVYARAGRDLHAARAPEEGGVESGECVAKRGEVCMFVYPMEEVTRGDETDYFMRCKTAHPRTGQPRMHWVRIVRMCAGKVTERCVGNFAIVPMNA